MPKRSMYIYNRSLYTPNRSLLVFQAVTSYARGMHNYQLPRLADLRHHCSECGKRFTRETSFRRHVAMHKGLYPYHCEVCGRGFASTNGLKGHLVLHTGIKTFACHVCGKDFSYSSTMKAHFKQFHADAAP